MKCAWLEKAWPNLEEAIQSALFMRVVTVKIRESVKHASNISVNFRLDSVGTSDEAMSVCVFCNSGGQRLSVSRSIHLRTVPSRVNVLQKELDILIQNLNSPELIL